MRRRLVIVFTAMAMLAWCAGAAAAGTTWTLQAVPSPANGSDITLDGISCPSATSCIAVGSYYSTSSGTGATLAEHWNGSTWSVQSTPDEAGAADSQLQGVSCTSPASCTAVGYYSNNLGDGGTLAEHWNGSTWSIQATPNRPGAETNFLYSVSCASPDSCTAVGQTLNHDQNDGRTLAEHWNGTKWAIQATPNPASSPVFDTLVSVSCAPADSCTAVGWYDADSALATAPLAEHWNGSTWSVQAMPSPAGSTGSGLNGVSCHSPAACIAVGESGDSAGNVDTLAEYWNGSTWAVQATPDPAGSSNSFLDGLSCSSAATCTAVGYYASSASKGTRTLAEHWDGRTWAIQHTPSPHPSYNRYLNVVSCTSPASCMAAGWYTTSSQAPGLPLAEAN